MSGLSDLLKRMSHYSLANFVIMAAGLVSFPILTRVLSVAEYGIMGLNVMLLTIVGSICKFGLQHSSIRLWAEWEKKESGTSQFILTLFLATLVISALIVPIYDGVILLLAPYIGRNLASFILLSSPLLLVQAMNSYGLNLLRARQWSKIRASFEVASTYTAMILAVLGATKIIGGLRGYYFGLMTGQSLVMVILLIYVLRGTQLRRENCSMNLMRAALAFGLPMTLFELSGVLFHLVDRGIIQWKLDETAVGYYTMAFNLSMYVNTLFTMPMDMAAVPMYTNIYEQQGTSAASEFLGKCARFFFLFAFPAIAGVMVVREDIVALLASKQFLPGAGLVHLILAGFLFYGSRTVLGAGMFLRKRPWLMASIELVGAILNVILNLLLIPHFNIHGAAYATLIAQSVMAVVFWILGSTMVPVPLRLTALLRYIFCAAAMALVIHYIHPSFVVLRLFLRLTCGIIIYSVLLLGVDREARELVSKVLSRIRRPAGGKFVS